MWRAHGMFYNNTIKQTRGTQAWGIDIQECFGNH